MLKLRIILTSALILLLVGLDMNVRAAVDSKKVDSKSTKKDDSKKESKEQEPAEKITEWDFFGAFSLVNIQLQWRDLIGVLNNESTNAESSINPNGLSLQEVENLSLIDKDHIVLPTAKRNSSIQLVPTFTYRVINGKTHFLFDHNKQVKSTIAYIQNCAIYPHLA